MRLNSCLKRDLHTCDEVESNIAVRSMSPESGLSILVVEDDEMCRAVVRSTLEHAGFEVMCASNVIEAIEFVENGAKIDIAIVDVIMPPGTPHGASFAQIARQRRPGLRVIFMSASLNPAGYALYGKNEAFLCKPFAPALLLEAITHIAG
jgi:CheY-like chemotaxis protein